MPASLSSPILIAACIIAGASLSTQSGINAKLSHGLHSPILAALVSFALGTLVLALVALYLNQYSQPKPNLSSAPWWAWTGGALGAFIVATMVFAAPKVGALTLAVSIVLGQVTASLIFDQFGLLGYPKISISLHRIIGSALILLGLFLVSRK